MSDLRDFIRKVDEIGELRVIEGANWQSEIGALTFSVAKGSNPPALLFDNIPGYPPGYRVFTLPFSSDRRLAVLWDQPIQATGLDIVRAMRNKLGDRFEKVAPAEVSHGQVLENILTGDDVDLFKFPTPQWQPLDGGRYIGTGGSVIMQDPDEGWVNLGQYRVQIHNKNTAGIMMEPGRHGRLIREKYFAKGKACPTAVTCGGDPVLSVISSQAIPWGVSEYDYTGWWQGKPIEVVKGPTTGLPIPADAEIVLEGEIVPPQVETLMEGPFAEYTGHYTPARPEPAFKVKCIMHRNSPILLGVLPYLGPGILKGPSHLLASARTWRKLDEIVPGVKAVWSPVEFGDLRTIVVSLTQKYSGHAKQAGTAALAARGYGQRYVIVVDDDVDPTNIREVLFALAYRAEPEEFDIVKGWWCGMSNPRLPPEKRAVGDTTMSSAVISACKPFHWIKDFPPSVRPSPELEKEVRQKFGKLAL